MRRWQDVKAVLTIVMFYLILELAFGITCPILYLTGISCAGCGMSRAWFSLLHLDMKGAFEYHPLFWLPAVAAILLIFWYRIPEKARKALIAAACVLFLLVYIWRMQDSSDTIVVFHPDKGALIQLILRIFHRI